MIDFGIVKPGTTLYVPFATYDSNDPSASVTLTGLATTDIEIYKNGSVTQRSSDNGYTLLDTDGIDFDSVTGIHGFSIDLADNSDAGFYAAGAQYTVVVASITVDAATINFIACTFRIGYPDADQNTTIATLASQTSFTLTAGPAEDDALNGCVVCIHDVASAVQRGYAVVQDYTGSTKTVTLTAATTFTAAATDNIAIYPPSNAQWGGTVAYSTTRGLAGTALPNAAADAAGGLPISDAGGLDLDAINSNVSAVLADTGTDGVVVASGSKTGYSLTATTGLGNQTADITGSLSGSVGSVTGAVGSVTGNVGGNVTGSVGSVTGGINTGAGVITTLDGLDTAQDTQHSTTQGKVDTAQADLDLLTGTDGATLATSQPNYAPATAAAATAIEADTQDIQSRLPAALVNSRMDSTIDGTGMESGAITAIWTTALTEAYRSTGAAGTAAQLLHEILQNLTEFDITSTTKTVKKFDGSTTAKTYTLDDATTPTSITETT